MYRPVRQHKDYSRLGNDYKAKALTTPACMAKCFLTALYFAMKENRSHLLTANRSNKQLFPTPESPISNSLKR